MKKVDIGPITFDYWQDVARIYQSGIETGHATFEKLVPDWETWNNSHRPDCRLLARLGDQIVAWAALSRYSDRCVYAGVAELSIYVDAGYRGRSIGDQLMNSLITESEANGIWTLLAGIFPENEASLSLHLKHGFRIVGIKKRLGKLDDQWRDVVLLERRSKVIGVD